MVMVFIEEVKRRFSRKNHVTDIGAQYVFRAVLLAFYLEFRVSTPNFSRTFFAFLAHLIAPPPGCVVSAVIVCQKKAFSTNECWAVEVFCRALGACLYSPGQSQSQSWTCDITCFHVIRRSAANLEGFHLKIPI